MPTSTCARLRSPAIWIGVAGDLDRRPELRRPGRRSGSRCGWSRCRPPRLGARPAGSAGGSSARTVRTTLDDPARDLLVGRRAATRLLIVARREGVSRPLPDVAGHVVEAIAVGCRARGPYVGPRQRVAPRCDGAPHAASRQERQRSRRQRCTCSHYSRRTSRSGRSGRGSISPTTPVKSHAMSIYGSSTSRPGRRS